MHRIGLSEDGESVTLRKFSGTFNLKKEFTLEWIEANRADLFTGIILDLETTGFSKESDHIIEIGIRQFKFDRRTGEVVKIEGSYCGLQDPGEPIPTEIKKVTGLTDEMLQGQSIDWNEVSGFVENADIVIAHNAGFDRGFAERLVPVSAGKIWGCSCNQIDWLAKGYVGKSLALLTTFHGFFYEAHRALSDSDALLHLLSMEDSTTGRPYLLELLNEVKEPCIQVVASYSPFERKDLLKKRGYRWSDAKKSWYCMVKESKKDEEIKWLEENIYLKAFPGLVKPIRRCDQFKSMVL